MPQSIGSSSPAAVDDEQYKWFVAMLMATVAVLAAILALCQAHAGMNATRANRIAQQSAILAIGLKTSGQAQVDFSLHVAQSWYELAALAETADEAGDAAAARRYRQVRNQVAELSPLVSETYAFDFRRFEADVYLEKAAALSETYASATALANAWSTRGRQYVAQLTLLATVLFLYGLSLTVSHRLRWPLLAAGSLLAAGTLLWAGVVFARPVTSLPQPAVDAYARGVALTHQERTQEALAAFDQAVASAPGYANAYLERANVHAARREYDAAVADYRAAQRAGRDNAVTGWNLGWIYYLEGRFDDAIAEDRRALELDRSLTTVRFNLAWALLAAGQVEAAQAEFDRAVDQAARQVADAHAAGEELPYSFWALLDATGRDLESLLAVLEGSPQPWNEAPPQSAFADPGTVQRVTEKWLVRVKSLAVALEQTGLPPSGVPTARLLTFEPGEPWGRGAGGSYAFADPRSPFELGTAVDTNPREYLPGIGSGGGRSNELSLWTPGTTPSPWTDTFAYGTEDIVLYFQYEGMRPGQRITWRFYRDGQEDSSLSDVEEWSLGESGWAEKWLRFAFSAPGDYKVEMYVDSHLIDSTGFTIEQPSEDS